MKKIFFAIISLAVLALGAWVLFLRAPAPRSQAPTTFSASKGQTTLDYKPFVIELVPPAGRLSSLPGTLEGLFGATEVDTKASDLFPGTLSKDPSSVFTGKKSGQGYVFNVTMAYPKSGKAIVSIKAPGAITIPVLIGRSQLEKGRAEVPMVGYDNRPKKNPMKCAGKSTSLNLTVTVPTSSRAKVIPQLRYVVAMLSVSDVMSSQGKLVGRCIVPISHVEFLGSELAAKGYSLNVKLNLEDTSLRAQKGSSLMLRAFNCPVGASIRECSGTVFGQPFAFDPKSQPILLPKTAWGQLSEGFCGGDDFPITMAVWNSETESASKVFE